MFQQTPDIELFKKQLKHSLKLETKNTQAVKFAKNENIYTCGDQSENIYIIESGQIKLLTLSPTGKECLLSIYTSGDIFGEICLCEINEHFETATAMEETFLKVIPRSRFIFRLSNDSLLEDFIRYLVMRISDQKQVITNLVTVDSEQRLGKTLLQLAKSLGEKHPRSIIIKHRITHEELSEMVGTTRPHITRFLRKFRKRNLIEINSDHFIIVKEKNLTEYLGQ